MVAFSRSRDALATLGRDLPHPARLHSFPWTSLRACSPRAVLGPLRSCAPPLWPFRSMPRARRGLRLSLFRLSHWHEQFDGASMKHAALNAHTRSGGIHRCSRLRFLAPRHFVILPDTMRYGGVHCSTACYCGVFLMTVVELKITHFLT